MSVQQSPSLLVAAVTQVLNRVREEYWRAGEIELRAPKVKSLLREICREAGCKECQLPEELLELRRVANDAMRSEQSVKLSQVMFPLIKLALPVAEPSE